MGLFYKDTVEIFNETDPDENNIGLKTRYDFGKKSVLSVC